MEQLLECQARDHPTSTRGTLRRFRTRNPHLQTAQTQESAPIHVDEPDISEAVVRSLLHAQCPTWARAPVEYLATSGTDNAMWRMHLHDGPDMVVRLPRRPGATATALREMAVLQEIERAPIGALVRTPRVRHLGAPQESFPHPWSVLEWIDGDDAWTLRDVLDGRARPGAGR